ncbi:MAG: 2-amino-4-hydroxy-6-hydroxymethyldihydropteridine diphosphokinase [Spirochaetes bacterium GWF1_51_8]|nr:MAG: 2-amino-4-hydroxy-6-hydroxymethyldihydropteridine diphosphokinase [Spirochaetes bacterium GWF1_51_8]
MIAYIGIGSNSGDKKKYIRDALEKLGMIASILQCSKPARFAPYGVSDQPDFINIAVKCETAFEPLALLDELLKIESDLGRVRTYRWGPREIDLDILLLDRMVLYLPNRKNPLIVPHPDMHKREFVLKPLCEIAPEAVHPVLRKTVRELLDDLIADTKG